MDSKRLRQMRTTILLSAIIIAYAILGNGEFLKNGLEILDIGLRFILCIFSVMDLTEFIQKDNKIKKLCG